jgi:putative FmdB family regulatory protein
MPLYEYRCKSCGNKEEKLEGFDAPTEHDCPECGKPLAMHRQVSLTSFTLAGGGWESQGYAHGAPGKDKMVLSAPAKTEGSTPAAGAAPAAAPAATPSAGGGCAGGCACHSSKPAK